MADTVVFDIGMPMLAVHTQSDLYLFITLRDSFTFHTQAFKSFFDYHTLSHATVSPARTDAVHKDPSAAKLY